MSDDLSALTSADYQALAEFRYRIRVFLRFSERAVRAAGLEPRQYELLLALKGLPVGRRPTVGELSARLQLQHHTVVELVDRLEQRGLVQRVRGEVDRRLVFVRLTSRGEAMLEQLALHHRAELLQAAPDLVRALNTLLAARGDAEERRGEER
ncbi:MAG TPA: MarR family transcriptional regulator [Chloroflexota bacterium]